MVVPHNLTGTQHMQRTKHCCSVKVSELFLLRRVQQSSRSGWRNKGNITVDCVYPPAGTARSILSHSTTVRTSNIQVLSYLPDVLFARKATGRRTHTKKKSSDLWPRRWSIRLQPQLLQTRVVFFLVSWSYSSIPEVISLFFLSHSLSLLCVYI